MMTVSDLYNRCTGHSDEDNSDSSGGEVTELQMHKVIDEYLINFDAYESEYEYDEDTFSTDDEDLSRYKMDHEM